MKARLLACSGFKRFRPFIGFETDEDEIRADNQRAFDQHTVGGQNFNLSGFAKAGQLVFKIHGFIEQSAGVKKALQRQSAFFVPFGEFGRSRVLFDNVTVFKSYMMLFQPALGFLAGGTFGIFQKQAGHGGSLLIVKTFQLYFLYLEIQHFFEGAG